MEIVPAQTSAHPTKILPRDAPWPAGTHHPAHVIRVTTKHSTVRNPRTQRETRRHLSVFAAPPALSSSMRPREAGGGGTAAHAWRDMRAHRGRVTSSATAISPIHFPPWPRRRTGGAHFWSPWPKERASVSWHAIVHLDTRSHGVLHRSTICTCAKSTSDGRRSMMIVLSQMRPDSSWVTFAWR